MNQQNAYVAISRAKESATVYTDSREKLAEQIGRESGQKETARSGEQRAQQNNTRDDRAERRVQEAEERLERYERSPGTPGGFSNRAAALDYAKRELDAARHARDRAHEAAASRGLRENAERDRPAPGDKQQPKQPAQQPRQQIDTRDHETRQRDAELARAALRTSGRYPQPAKINRDIDRGKARYEYDSRGE
jgi:hypothetical protein